MYRLGLGGLDLEHSVDQHRPEGYKVPDFLSSDENPVFQNARSLSTMAEFDTTETSGIMTFCLNFINDT